MLQTVNAEFFAGVYRATDYCGKNHRKSGGLITW